VFYLTCLLYGLLTEFTNVTDERIRQTDRHRMTAYECNTISEHILYLVGAPD